MNITINGDDVLFVLEITSRDGFDEMYKINQTKIVSTYDEIYKLNNYIRLNPIHEHLIYQIWPVRKEWHSKGGYVAKRTAQPVNKYEVISWYKWFDWSLCCVCNQEFRREKGFAWSRSNTTYTKFMCASCGCHSQDFVYVNKYIDYMIGSKRLPVIGASNDLPHIPPPAPPMREVRSNS